MLTASSAAAGLHTRSTLGGPGPPRPLTAAWLPVQVIHALSFGLLQLQRTPLAVRSRIATSASSRAPAGTVTVSAARATWASPFRVKWASEGLVRPRNVSLGNGRHGWGAQPEVKRVHEEGDMAVVNGLAGAGRRADRGAAPGDASDRHHLQRPASPGVASFDAPMSEPAEDGRTGRVAAGCVFWPGQQRPRSRPSPRTTATAASAG